ncbi:HD family phosphohydrolase [Lacticaseibacillus daqingensis]|uniref:HD family phosphohydrolase n=1 Tax=Lacticaseibacillus daqingensis TaxID=2486014 RepID=UPI000F7AEB68|nr:HDIG domain-containing metalloprotein [Lacticaseibacillus daqingensis]
MTRHIRRPVLTGLVLGLFSVACFLLLLWQVLPQPLAVNVNTVARQTIIATQTVQDQARTQEVRTAARNAVTPVYTYDSSIAGKQLDKLQRLQKAVAATVTSEATAAQKAGDETTYKAPTAAALTRAFKAAYPKADYDYFYQYDTAFYQGLFGLDKADREALFTAATSALTTQLSGRIDPSTLTDAKASAKQAIATADLTAGAARLALTLVDTTLVPNELVDSNQTKAKQAAAVAAVNPVLILQGQVIVQEGHLVDSTAMHQLAVLGLTKRGRPTPVIALALVVLVQLGMLAVLLAQYAPALRLKYATLYAALMLIMLGLMLGLRVMTKTGQVNLTLLLPVAVVPLLLRTFIGRRMALIGALMQTMLAYFAFYSTTGNIFTAGTAVTYLTTGLLAVMISHDRLTDVFGRVAFWVLGVNLALTLTLMLLQGANFARPATWQQLGFTLVGQLLGYLLAIGVTPYLELLWHDDALFTLNRLSNPNDPLLKRLLEEAPGTYHHSMMVANLAANAVAVVGGRQMLTRVACYYHDVGKLTRPLYFTENMPAGYVSPHDALTPQQSAQIIFAHVTDGVAMLKARKMPQFIIDVCAQHHGTTLMQYFYVTAKNADPTTEEPTFRYPGPKPQTLEAAVINIADTCEAAVRSMPHPTPAGIQAFVHKIINARLVDGQFDEAPITVSQLRQVEKSLNDGLASTFYNRIEYPKLKDTEPDAE